MPWDMQIHTNREIAANKPDINQVSYDHRSYELINSYSSRTRRIWADIYNQRGRRPSWLLSAHIRQVREE